MKHTQVVKLTANEGSVFEFRLVGYPKVNQGDSIRVKFRSLNIDLGTMKIINRLVDGSRGCIVLSPDTISNILLHRIITSIEKSGVDNGSLLQNVYCLPDVKWEDCG